jgi:hypothetical protein
VGIDAVERVLWLGQENEVGCICKDDKYSKTNVIVDAGIPCGFVEDDVHE